MTEMCRFLLTAMFYTHRLDMVFLRDYKKALTELKGARS